MLNWLMRQWWRAYTWYWNSGAAYLVTSNLFFLMLSTPGFSRSGSPFFPVCFLDFLFTAWLMVLAQCFGSSCMVEGETGKRAPSLFIPMSKQRDKSRILWKSYESLSCLLTLLQKHRWGEDLWALSQEEGRGWYMRLAEERTSGEVLLS